MRMIIALFLIMTGITSFTGCEAVSPIPRPNEAEAIKFSWSGWGDDDSRPPAPVQWSN